MFEGECSTNKEMLRLYYSVSEMNITDSDSYNESVIKSSHQHEMLKTVTITRIKRSQDNSLDLASKTYK
jgi:hypothetical protein